MEFHEKLQELRKKKGLTQEELAQVLYVSRTAISKWETDRGYPSIDSLKAIAKFFSVSVDELLSGEEALTIAEEDNKQKQKNFCGKVFGLLDLSVAMFFVLPLFGQKVGEHVNAVPLLALTQAALYMKIAYCAAVIVIMGWGILTLALKDRPAALRIFWKNTGSLLLNAAGVLLFIIGSQPYAAAFLFVLLAIKVLLLAKMQ
jgi:transcriptional regulator with XRE-family HTH domain